MLLKLEITFFHRLTMQNSWQGGAYTLFQQITINFKRRNSFLSSVTKPGNTLKQIAGHHCPIYKILRDLSVGGHEGNVQFYK